MEDQEIRKLPAPENGERVESGAVQFGDDWPGTFIRGDNAFGYRMFLDEVLVLIKKKIPDAERTLGEHLALMNLEGLAELLDACNVNLRTKRTVLRTHEDFEKGGEQA